MRVFFYAVGLGVIGLVLLGPIGGSVGAVVGAVMGLASQLRRQGQRSTFSKMGDTADTRMKKRKKEQAERDKAKSIVPDARYD